MTTTQTSNASSESATAMILEALNDPEKTNVSELTLNFTDILGKFDDDELVGKDLSKVITSYYCGIMPMHGV